jgi:hypothetical protein
MFSMSFLDMAKDAAATALDKTNAVAGAVAETAKDAGAAVATGAAGVTHKAADVASPAVDATKNAAHHVGDVASSVGSAVLAGAEKLTGIDLNKDGKIG